MEMLPDQKPPVPRGEGPLAKAIFFGIIGLILGSVALYAMYPPLKKAGRINFTHRETLAVYIGESYREIGKFRHISILEAPGSAEPEFLQALAKAQCEEALKETRLLGTRQQISPTGELTVRFVKGGRFFYRFYDFDDWQMTYSNKTCTVAPYLSEDLEGWVLHRVKMLEGEGAQGVRVAFRWEGRGEAPELPLKEICQMVVSTPPRQLRDLFNGEIEIVEIVQERGLDLGIVELYSWIGFRFKRVKNLCLEIGPVVEEA